MQAATLHRGAIQSDAALRQSTEGRQMAAATLSVGVLLAILEAAPEIRVPFRVDSHHSSKLGGKSQGGRRDRNQPYRESPQRECITLDRTRSPPHRSDPARIGWPGSLLTRFAVTSAAVNFCG